jgi:hypothetical protein
MLLNGGESIWWGYQRAHFRNETKSNRRNQSYFQQTLNLIAWVLALTLMVTVMIEAVVFHQATVCRQKAWLKGVELQTGTLLHRPKDQALGLDAGCKLYVVRKHQRISWKRLPNLKTHEFVLPLKGKL